MHEYIVTFWCNGDVSDIYVHTGKVHYIPKKEG